MNEYEITQTTQNGLSISEDLHKVNKAIPQQGRVLATYSDRNTCDISCENGAIVYNVPLCSKIGLLEEEVYGELDLPAVDDMVLINFSKNEMGRPYIIGTMVPYLYSKFQLDQVPVNSSSKSYTLKLLEANKNKTYKRIFKSGATMEVTEDGSFIFETPSGNVLNINETDGEFILEDAINGNKITLNDSGILVEDLSTNSIEMAAAGITVTDANGCIIETTSTGTTINGNFEVLV